jgi:hypothetical protein
MRGACRDEARGTTCCNAIVQSQKIGAGHNGQGAARRIKTEIFVFAAVAERHRMHGAGTANPGTSRDMI